MIGCRPKPKWIASCSEDNRADPLHPETDGIPLKTAQIYQEARKRAVKGVRYKCARFMGSETAHVTITFI